MTKIKLCGMMRREDIETANALLPDYIGFIFAKKSRRYVSPERAAALKKLLSDKIKAVGVFVDEEPENIASLAESGTIDVIQLHGNEDDGYIYRLRELTKAPIIKAFRVKDEGDIEAAEKCPSDMVLLDAAEGGSGKEFDRTLASGMTRDYFLAGGLYPETVAEAIEKHRPYGVDVSSGIESDGAKDKNKMESFVKAVRRTDGKAENI